MNQPNQAEFTTITDPLGHTIQLPLNLCCNKDGFFNDKNIYNDISEVIAKPAMLIEMEDTNELCYYRVIGSEKQLLIIAKENNGTWTAYQCVKNPCSEYLLELMKKGAIITLPQNFKNQ